MVTKPLRIVFFGSPSFALPSLESLRDAGHRVVLVVSQPDRPAGRGRRLMPPPVARYARDCDLPLWQTATLRGPEAEERLRAAKADAMALAAFAALVPRNLLDLAPTGILNVHPSLLPRWRGAAPIQSSLLTGDAETGVSIIRLVAAMDAGPILLRKSTSITPDDDYLTLEPRLASLGAALLVEALEGAVAGTIEPTPQDAAAATYCKKIERDDARIDWNEPAERIWNQVRAYRGWPQAFTTFRGQTLKVLRARPLDVAAPAPGLVAALPDGNLLVGTGSGALRLDEVTPEGKRPQAGADFLRGHPEVRGARLGT